MPPQTLAGFRGHQTLNVYLRVRLISCPYFLRLKVFLMSGFFLKSGISWQGLRFETGLGLVRLSPL